MNHPRNHRDSIRPATAPDDSTVSVEGAPRTLETLPPHDGKQRDELLQLIRRLDWRFLLPDPVLRHVAFLGDDDPELTQGLRRTSRALSLLDLHWRFPEGQEPRFDTVVLRSARLQDADRAARLVHPGGCLYWEIEPSRLALGNAGLRERLFPHPADRQAPTSLVRLRSHLGQLGFTHVQFHWHRPSFRGAVEIIPLEDEGILRFVLDGRGARFPGRVKRLGARWLLQLGLLRGLVPSLSVIACKRPCKEDA